MGAFEKVSRIRLSTVDEEHKIHHHVDLRTEELPFERPPDDGFDPRDHRHSPSPIKPWMAYFNLLRVSVSAGMLGIPMGISQAGLILGPILTILIGILIIHMHLTLLNCLTEISRQLKTPYISYRYGFRMALLHGPPCFHCIGRRGPTIIAILMILGQCGICTVYVILTSDNLRDMFDFTSSVPGLLILYIPYIILEILMKTLTIVSYAALFSNALNLIGMSLVFYLILENPHGETIYAAKTPLALLLASGMMMFNFSCIGVVLSCDKALINPKIMTTRFGVITVGMMVPTIISAIYGTMGYWSFGTMEENILRSLPFDHPVTQIALAVYLVALATAYPIQCYPAVEIAKDIFKNNDPRHTPDDLTLKLVEYFERPMFVTTTFVIAYLLPFQASLVAFVGNLCSTMLSLVFPAMMEIGILYPHHYGRFNWKLLKDLIILTLGVVMWFTGVWSCGHHLYVLVKTKENPLQCHHMTDGQD